MWTAPGTWPEAHSCSSRVSTTVIGSALRIHSAMSSTSTVSKGDSPRPLDPAAPEPRLRRAVLRVCAARKHDGPPARDQPAHPRAERAVQAHAVAARDVAAVIVTPAAEVSHTGALPQ